MPKDPTSEPHRSWEPTPEDLAHSGPLWPAPFTEDHLRALRDHVSNSGIVALPPTEEVFRRDPDSPPEDPRWVRVPDDVPRPSMTPARYVPDLSEVPPDPAEPVPVAFRAWEPTAADLLHSGPLWPEHFSKEHEDAQRWKREGRFVRVPESEAPTVRDPRLAGIDALIDHASSHDASLVPAPRPLILTREQGTALLRALYRSGVKRVQCLTAAGRPADGDPPPSSALTYPDAGRVWLPPRHGKSLLWAGLLDELERPKEPPELPPSPVVQAALVVDPADPPEES